MYQMQGPGSGQGSLPCIRELFGRRGTDAIEVGGTSRAKCGDCTLVCDFSSRRKAHDIQLSPVNNYTVTSIDQWVTTSERVRAMS